MQIGLFRKVGDLAYLPVATTGNLMRFVESGYDGFVGKDAAARRAFGAGALAGAVASRAWNVHAIWLAAGFLAVTLALFVVDQRVLR